MRTDLWRTIQNISDAELRELQFAIKSQIQTRQMQYQKSQISHYLVHVRGQEPLRFEKDEWQAAYAFAKETFGNYHIDSQGGGEFELHMFNPKLGGNSAYVSIIAVNDRDIPVVKLERPA